MQRATGEIQTEHREVSERIAQRRIEHGLLAETQFSRPAVPFEIAARPRPHAEETNRLQRTDRTVEQVLLQPRRAGLVVVLKTDRHETVGRSLSRLHRRHFTHHAAQRFLDENIGPGLQRGDGHAGMPMNAGRHETQVYTTGMRGQHGLVIGKDFAAAPLQILHLCGHFVHVDHRGGHDHEFAAITTVAREIQVHGSVAGDTDQRDTRERRTRGRVHRVR